jgi:hypothetical protein
MGVLLRPRGLRDRVASGRFAAPGALALAAVALAAWPAPAAAQWGAHETETTHAEEETADRPRRLPFIGLMGDVGVPDGLMASLVVRPIEYLRLYGGAGGNTSSPGIRGGLSVLPLGAGPSLNLEVGHYLDGEANGLVRTFVGGLGRFADYVNRLDYTFANAHLGLDLGRRDFTFFIHGGFTFVRARLKDVTPPPELSPTGKTSITFHEDPIIKMFTPSVKLGFIVYLQ